jgi:hypothetical protein
MAIAYFAGNRWTGTSSDRAGITTANIVAGLTFLETNTDDLYQWDGDSWNVIAGNTVTQTLEGKTIVAGNNTISGLVNANLSGSAGITNANLATPTITLAAEAGSNDAVALGETFTFTAGTGIDTTMGTNAVTIAGSDASTSAKGIASFSSDNFAASSGVITIKNGGVNNDELAGSIANAKLANSAITIGGTATSLGGTITALTALTDLDLTVGSKTIFDTIGPNTLTIGANNTTVSIAGNLLVGGTTTTLNSTTLTVDDPIITLGGDTAPGSDDNKDRGVEFRYHDGSSARVGFFGFDDSATTFTGFTAATNSSEVFSGTVMNAVFGNVTAATQSANNDSTYAATTAYVQAELTAYAADTVTFTNKTHTNPVLNGTLSGSGFLDEDNFASNSATAVASQQSIAAYVAAQVSGEDLDVTSDSGTIDVDLNSETLTIAGGTGLASAASGTTVTLNIDSTVATLTGAQTLTSKTLTAPKVANAGFIADANGAEQIIFATTASAVNELTITNGATGNPAQIAASGETNIGLKLAGKGTEGVILTNATANGAFLEFDTKAAPADPSAEQARLYLKQVDGNNNALAVKIQKAGAIVEVEITSPKAVCGVCGSKDGASDPTYDFSRDVMILDLWCGHSFEVPMQQWSHINGNS